MVDYRSQDRQTLIIWILIIFIYDHFDKIIIRPRVWVGSVLTHQSEGVVVVL